MYTPVPYLWKVLAIRTADWTVKALGFLFRASSSSPIPRSLRYRFLFFSAFGPLCFARCFFFSFSFSSISPARRQPTRSRLLCAAQEAQPLAHVYQRGPAATPAAPRGPLQAAAASRPSRPARTPATTTGPGAPGECGAHLPPASAPSAALPGPCSPESSGCASCSGLPAEPFRRRTVGWAGKRVDLSARHFVSVFVCVQRALNDWMKLWRFHGTGERSGSSGQGRKVSRGRKEINYKLLA